MATDSVPRAPATGLVKIDAAPQAFNMDLGSAAVLVVDMQNDFGAEGGMFHRAGIDISMIRQAVTPTARVLAAARQCGIAIIYLKMAFRADLSDAGPADSPNYARHLQLGVGTTVRAPSGATSRVLIRDTWSTEILPELEPEVGDVVLYKHRFSGFFETELDAVLRSRRIRHLIVTGCTTSICVEATIRDAMHRDYGCLLLADCCGEPIGHDLARSNHDASLLTIQVLLGWVSSSDQFVRALGARGEEISAVRELRGQVGP